jgi:Flp pilus assembly protein TadB
MLGMSHRPTAHRITTARKSVADDQASRVRGYVISMTIRIICFLLAVVTTGVLRWLFVAGALVIPYIAVVFANGGREPAPETPETLRGLGDRELPSGRDGGIA